ncbi:hypothetical protein Tco_0996865 [Tanacetum coccineum]
MNTHRVIDMLVFGLGYVWYIAMVSWLDDGGGDGDGDGDGDGVGNLNSLSTVNWISFSQVKPLSNIALLSGEGGVSTRDGDLNPEGAMDQYRTVEVGQNEASHNCYKD